MLLAMNLPFSKAASCTATGGFFLALAMYKNLLLYFGLQFGAVGTRWQGHSFG